ncbi:MAG: hypothetical protein ACM3O8_14440 [Methylococcaceae bacterium]
MRNNLAILILVFLTIALSTFGQQVRETSLGVGISKNSYPKDQQFYEEELPYYLIINGSKSWYSNDHRLSLRKEAGINLQYASIGFNTGGLGASSKYTGSITSLFANVSLRPSIHISQSLIFAAGPEAEVLLMGYNNIDYEFYSMIYDPPTFGNKKLNGFNRDYFNQPSFGIKASLLESNPDTKVNIGLSLSYLWTKSDPSNYYAERFARFSIVIGFKKQKDKAPEESNL